MQRKLPLDIESKMVLNYFLSLKINFMFKIFKLFLTNNSLAVSKAPQFHSLLTILQKQKSKNGSRWMQFSTPANIHDGKHQKLKIVFSCLVR